MEKSECPNCGSPVASQAAGSITQWISSCKCFSRVSNQQEQLLSITVTICTMCKKRIATNKGSLTQWVFGKDLCSCNRPKTTEKTINTYVDSVDSAGESKPKEEEIELEGVADNFPKERYEPLAELGRGASGIVYLCRDIVLNKKVAVKTLSQLTDEQLVSFQNEARATSSLDHPYLLTILDFGANKDGAPYMVSEYFSGVNLEKFLKDYGRLDKEVAKEVFKKLASVLEYVHSNNIYHRDIKPSNVLLSIIDDNINIKLVDFGIAKVKEDTGHITVFQNKTLAGTPLYMAPDTAAGFEYDRRSEIYSLGCVLYECLTGEPVYKGQTALDILNKHMTSPTPDLSQFEDFEEDKNWVRLLNGCLAKQKDERFQSMGELLENLELVETEYRTRVSSDSSKASSKAKPIYILVPLILLIVGGIFLFQTNNNKERVPEDVKTLLKEAKVLSSDDKNWTKAVSYLRKAAEKGSVEAQLKLGHIYKSGKPEVPKQSKESFKWYQMAAENNSNQGKLEVARCYRRGFGVTKNRTTAFNLYLDLAEKENFDKAQIELAECYAHGLGTEKDRAKAFHWYQEAAKQDSNYSIVALGDCYSQKIGVAKDYAKALSLYRKAEKRGSQEAKERIGWMYEHGYGVTANPEISFAWYLKAAKEGDKVAQLSVGDYYRIGKGTSESEESALYWYRKAADQGSSEGLREIGKIFVQKHKSNEQKKKGFAYFKQAARKGNETAMNAIGNCYEFGKGVKKDKDKAFHWYKKAAEKGSMWGQTNYAACYFYGIGTKKDKHKAFELYKKAAKNKANEKAFSMIANCYRSGSGTKRDYKKAMQWYQKAFKAGDEDSWRSIGHLYYFGGPGLKKDQRVAFKYYQESASQNHEPALFDVGWCYEHGEGVRKDLKKAFQHYQKGALAEEDECRARLGYLYLNGIGTQKDINKAIKLFKMTASKGNKHGANYLAYCYEKGLGVEKDVPRAIEMYNKLASKSFDMAIYNLARCYEFGIGVDKDRNKALSLYKEVKVYYNKEAKAATKRLTK